MPISYEKCACSSCEYKTYRDHILRDDDEDDKSPYGNLHREKVNIEVEDEK